MPNVALIDEMIQGTALAESREYRAAMAVHDIRRAISVLFEMSYEPGSRDALVRELNDIQEATIDLILVRERIEARDFSQVAAE